MVPNWNNVRQGSIGIFTALILFLSGCKAVNTRSGLFPKEEFRGFWVATVVNIDWPKSPNDDIEKKKRDYLKILDFYQNLNFNAAIVQIRTAGDAFYQTDKAPWSQYLIGKQGKEIENHVNLLHWMIAETHRRGFEFHAWLNPYRATFNLDTAELSGNHDYFKYPDWMIKYGNKYYYNPGVPEVQNHLVEIVKEVVVNYDIDAIHFDDYFYPYQIAGEEFDDNESYLLFRTENQSKEDWRRSNVNKLIQEINTMIKENKPWIQFGISPFGVWRNQTVDISGSDTKAGQTNYDNLFADPLKWIEEGWIDYILPQIYWSLDFSPASHKKIMQWWISHTGNTNLYVGNAPYKIKNNADKAWKKKKELPLQIAEARKYNRVKGNVFFSAKSLMDKKNENLVTLLKKKYYQYPALTPSLPGIRHIPKTPNIAEVKKFSDQFIINLKVAKAESLRYLVLYAATQSTQVQINNPAHIIKKYWINDFDISENGLVILKVDKQLLEGKKIAAISSLDKFNVESLPEIFSLIE